MNLENLSTAVLIRWGMFALATVVAWVLLGLNDLAGLIPVTLVLAFLLIFPEPTIRFTDADADALLGRT
jgi:hypothetical protein